MNNDAFMIRLDTEIAIRGLSRRQLALRGGFDPSVLSNYAAGAKNPSMEVCTKIAKVLGLPPELVLEWAGLLETKKGESAALRELRLLEDDITDEEAYLLTDILRGLKTRRQGAVRRDGGARNN